jgi:hypothetical protein
MATFNSVGYSPARYVISTNTCPIKIPGIYNQLDLMSFEKLAPLLLLRVNSIRAIKKITAQGFFNLAVASIGF